MSMLLFQKRSLLRLGPLIALFIILYPYFLQTPMIAVDTVKTVSNSTPKHHWGYKYLMKINEERINRLFDILHDSEPRYASILNELKLISFSNLVENKPDDAAYTYQEELKRFTVLNNNRVRVTKEFIDHLDHQSALYSFIKQRDNVVKAQVKDNKPVIVTAASSAFWSSLQATVFSVKQNFPDFHLIVYDLGLSPEQAELTRQNCDCELIRFDASNNYSKISPHVADLRTYAWKPLIIQEALRNHETVMYIDSSIRFYNNELEPVLSTLRQVGLLTQYIGLKLTCYTNPLQFNWFGEEASSYKDFDTIEANILFFHRNFLSSLIVKAWVQCALDKNCIAPPGSRLSGCCGCHRFDQDAITIISSFFYGHPWGNKYLPAYSFTKGESYFFQVKRLEGMSYFTKRAI